MRLDRWLTLFLVYPLRMLLRKALWCTHNAGHPSTPVLPILMYHSISDDAEPGLHPYYRLCTSPHRFMQQMQWLDENGYRGVTLTEGLAWLFEASAESQNPKIETPKSQPVALTFDDGFHDFYTTAFPILNRLSFRATVYLPTGFIGKSRRCFRPTGRSTVPGVVGRPCLTWSEVTELDSAGIEIGGHTVTHPILPTLKWDEIECEAGSCKKEIEQHLGKAVRTFAHPYTFPIERGDYVAGISAILNAIGYTSAVTTSVGCVCPDADPFQLRRLPINHDDDRWLLKAKLNSAYDWVGSVQSLAHKLRSTLSGWMKVENRRKPFGKDKSILAVGHE